VLANTIRVTFAILALAGTSAPALAQEEGQEIVVVGRGEVTEQQAQHYVRAIAQEVGGQMARFDGPVCPVVIGLPDQYAAMVGARIRKVANAARIPVAPADCEGNIVLIVAADADALVKDLRANVPNMFAGMDLQEVRKAMREGPVHVWSSTEVRSEDGLRLTDSGLETKGNNSAPTLRVHTASVINLPTRQVTMRSIVVIDDQAVLGKSLNQIADYVSMRALAGARPPAGGTGDTILALFDPAVAAPAGLTYMDAAYLAGLYRTAPNQKSIYQMAGIAHRIARDSGSAADD
jgi:hypothetical protein